MNLNRPKTKSTEDCTRELFSQKLNALVGKPAKMSPIKTIYQDKNMILEYRYPDDADNFKLSPEMKTLVNHLSEQITQLEKQGVKLTGLELVTELQEDENTLDYETDVVYEGSLGDVLKSNFTLSDNLGGNSSKTLTIRNKEKLTIEKLGVLKLEALRTYMTQKGIPANLISLYVRYNYVDNTFREETLIYLKVR